MDDYSKQIETALIEIRNSALSITLNAKPNTEPNPRPVWDKYDMLILGEKFNIIYSIELCHCLSEKFNCKISLDQLHVLLPDICDALGMSYEPMIEVSDVGKTNPPVANYSINLF